MKNLYKPLLIGCLVLVGLFGVLIFGVLIMFGVAVESGWMANTEVTSGDKLPKHQHQEISKIIDLRPDEKILYFYSTEMFVGSEGNLVTDQRVVSYQMFEDEMDLYSADYDEITNVEMTQSTSFLEDSAIEIHLQDDWFMLYISNENRGDKKFYDALMRNWKQKRE